MCQEPYTGEFPADERGGILIADAAAAVVGALSVDTCTKLLETLICQSIGDAGDQSDLPMFELVMSNMPPPPPYHVADKDQVRATCAAAAALCSMLIGHDRTEQAARLALATIVGRVFEENIQ